jgi:inorganic phosphate transporter, PiT family
MLNLVFFVIAVAVVFDFLNGFHDAANSVATVVTTRVLSPLAAVFWAAFFNFAAAFIFGTGVAQTISGHLIDPHVIDVYVVFGGLLGAISWDILTWWLALPTSSSHAIISGFAGAAIAKAGVKALLLKGWVPVIAFLIVSPIFGFILAYIVMVAVTWTSHKTPRHKAETVFRRLQLVSAGAYSLGHGTNDAQKTMGIIVALLLAAGKKDWASGGSFLGRQQEIAWWIILSCHAAMGLGTLLGGWRIVKTMGSRITPHLRPIGGF